jgi:hypothetical protein
MKDIPTKDSVDYEAFWANERDKAEYGVTVNGVFISGWLYWHTQLWNIYIDEEDPRNPDVVKRIFKKAQFRDNEWIIDDAMQEAQKAKKGVMIFGSRRLGKSEFLSSHLGRYSTLYEGSENIVTGGNWGDIDVIMFKLTQGLNALPEYFKAGRLAENLRKEVELGFKTKKGERLSWSKIIARNHEEGLKTEALAGLTASSFVMDEVGKSPFAEVWEAAKPAFTSPYGWRCVPVLTGTSGDIKASSDAEKFFNKPEAYNFIARELVEEGNKKVSVFISGFHRMEGKVDTTIAGYVETQSGIMVPADSELHKIRFQTTDVHKAELVIDEERAQAAQSPDPTALLKATMYYPKNTSELFLSDNGNNFPIEAINEQIAYLEANEELQGLPIRVYRDTDNKAKYSFNTTKKPLLEYPIKPGEVFKQNAAPVMFEPPSPDAPTYLYISGADPYNESSSKYSNSVGAMYIYKRVYDPIDGTFQRRIVLSYVARPETLKIFHETVEMLLEIYGCICMPENGPTFVQYFDLRNRGYLLADGYDFLKEIAPNTSITQRPKGLPAIPKVQSYYKELVYQYLTEEVIMGTDKETGELIKKMGVVRIPDIGLLRELAAWNDEGNFDRYVAFGHTLAHEAWADKIYPFHNRPARNVQAEVVPDKKKPKIVRSPFALDNANPFGVKPTRPRSPFG